MIARFFASLIANISEDLLMDLFSVVLKEIALTRKKADMSKTVQHLKAVIDEVAAAGELSDAEKNTRLADAGRAVIERMRTP